jgi:hypothetical protein
MRSSRPGGLAQLSAGLWLSATELETWGLLRAVQSLSPNVFFERFPANQANSSAPAGVNFTLVPDSCRHSQPLAIAASMPARYSAGEPPAARKAALMSSM